jgi:proteasome accessory factor B
MNSPKLRRWIDLLAALLRRNYAVTLEELTREVPAYGTGAQKAALRRMFERDKDELRAFGIPIQTVPLDDGNESGYRLERKNFYLPYLSVIREGRRSTPRRVDHFGYRALTELTFEPDELDAVVQAASRVLRLGDPVLAAHARSALRKLAFDLPVDAMMVAEPRELFSFAAAMPSQAPTEIFAVLDDALHRRKRVTVDYHTMGTDATTARELLPYGLFFLGHHWYLAARDADDGPVKNFRLNRINRAAVNPRNANSADYTIPADFRLRDHARSRQSWELGDGSVLEAIVAFPGTSGPAKAAQRLGEPVPGASDRRRFLVRRPDAFARWLQSFGGELVPVAPAELVTLCDDLARRTLDVYQAAG